MTQEEAKRMAAQAALELLPERGVIGLGSGSTANLFIRAVGELVAGGRELVGVPTSQESRRLAEELGIPLLDDAGPWLIDVCVDGADEVSDGLDLIKGGGACHAREKIVNAASRINVIVVDDSKLSRRLGTRWPVPIEVLRFGHRSTAEQLTAFGDARLRERDGTPVLTDAQNPIYDVHVGAMDDPAQLDAGLRRIPGVVETGLFVGRADYVIVSGEQGVQRRAARDLTRAGA